MGYTKYEIVIIKNFVHPYVGGNSTEVFKYPAASDNIEKALTKYQQHLQNDGEHQHTTCHIQKETPNDQ